MVDFYCLSHEKGALTMGMIVGVVSYRQRCFEKIMSLDNSRLADEVRKFQQRLVLSSISTFYSWN